MVFLRQMAVQLTQMLTVHVLHRAALLALDQEAFPPLLMAMAEQAVLCSIGICLNKDIGLLNICQYQG